ETLLEEVNGECGGANREEVVPDYAKGVMEASDYVVESEVERGRVLGTELSRKCSAVASVTSAEVSNEVSECGKGSKVREQVRQEEAAKGSSGRGRVARNYSVVRILSTPVLAKVRTLSGR
ncbi:unnamed protein product, partial [Closterium sp. NIES-53]